jgi:excisionase family DNA binding protein
MTLAADKLAYNINEAAAALGISRSTLYEIIRAGELEMGKLHGRSVILAENLKAWLDSHYQPEQRRPRAA